MSNWYWSHKEDGNSFHGPFETKAEAIDEAKTEGADPIFIGQSRTVEVEVDADDAIDNWANGAAADRLYEDALDFWCHKIPQEDRDALSAELTEVFKKHLSKWGEDTSWEVIGDAVRVSTEEYHKDG